MIRLWQVLHSVPLHTALLVDPNFRFCRPGELLRSPNAIANGIVVN